MSQPKKLFNISGPYAVGKDTILNSIIEAFGERVHRVHTITTRPVSKEADPTYTHVEPDEFDKIVASSDWIANRQYSGHTGYATNLSEIRQAIDQGLICVHSIYAGDHGAGALRSAFGPVLYSLAILPSSGPLTHQLDVLRERLYARNRDDPDALVRRVQSQLEPIEYINLNPSVQFDSSMIPVFDRVLINEHLDRATQEALSIFSEEFS